MAKITKEMALRYHSEGRPGKIEVVPTKPYRTQTDLSRLIRPAWLSPAWRFRKIPTTLTNTPTKATSWL